MAIFGFVAGSLVHTDEGLVAIEQLKVGNMVLSRPENDPDAPNEYKRVVRTFKSAEIKKITYVSYDAARPEDTPTGSRYLFCTEDHPFWTVAYDHENGKDVYHQLGWQAANSLSMQDRHLLKTYNDCYGFVMDYDAEKKDIYEIDNSKIAFLYGNGDDPWGMYDFHSGQPVCIGGLTYKSLHPSEAKSAHEIKMLSEIDEITKKDNTAPYFDVVYNIEVEDFHTYFVGEAGVWVHTLP